jgi:hypothetical protein
MISWLWVSDDNLEERLEGRKGKKPAGATLSRRG